MYDSLFCRLYNEFGWNEYPRVFGEQLVEWLSRNGIRADSALDIGCGTGVLCEALSEHGIDAIGIDLSPEMIAIARERAPHLRFEVADMVAFRSEPTRALVTCTGDAINHIDDLEAVGRVFRNAFAALRPGGLFVFDLLKAEEVPQGEPFEVDYGDLRIRFLAEMDGNGYSTLRIDALENGSPNFSEEIREKVHDPQAIRALLANAGFHIRQFDDRLLPDSDAHGTTWFIVAQKPDQASG